MDEIFVLGEQLKSPTAVVVQSKQESNREETGLCVHVCGCVCVYVCVGGWVGGMKMSRTVGPRGGAR